MKLHDAIRKIRQSLDLTQENLADELGVDKTTIIRYEKDASIIQFGQLEKIAQAFNMTVNELTAYRDRKNLVEEPELEYGKLQQQRSVFVGVHLDGTKPTLDYWLSTLKKFNASIA